MAFTKEGRERERSYMPKVKEILSKRFDKVEEYSVDQASTDNGDRSTVATNYTYGDLKLTKGNKSYNIEIKGTGWVAKNQGLEENGKRDIDFYGFLVKNYTELWIYRYSQIKELFRRVAEENPERFNRERGTFSKMPGLKIYLKKELPHPLRVYT